MKEKPDDLTIFMDSIKFAKDASILEQLKKRVLNAPYGVRTQRARAFRDLITRQIKAEVGRA